MRKNLVYCLIGGQRCIAAAVDVEPANEVIPLCLGVVGRKDGDDVHALVGGDLNTWQNFKRPTS